ncbi:MAG: hypothetical protein NZ750_09340 [Anaerolineae bacterium]|nr:hypothetical protein [Anaerolineae bacterium]MDW8171823.1 hypothetical protein [Anaerolineae bacterium]
MPLKPHTDYFFEERNGKGYFLLNGDLSRVEDVAEQLRRAGWQVHKIAKSWLPTKRTGVQYEWYVWVSNPDGTTPHWTDFKDFASVYQPILEQEREQERQRTLAELSQSRQQIEQLLDQTQYLQEGRAQLEQRLRDISREYQEIQQYYELFQGENVRLEGENKELRTKVYTLESRIEQLESVIDSYQGREDTAISGVDYQIAFNTLFPQVEMLGQSLRTLANWRSTQAALRVIFQIVGGESLGKRFQAAGGEWMEVSKVANGQDDSGRIYYRCCKGDSGTHYRILISVKERQDHDAKYLSSQ